MTEDKCLPRCRWSRLPSIPFVVFLNAGRRKDEAIKSSHGRRKFLELRYGCVFEEVVDIVRENLLASWAWSSRGVRRFWWHPAFVSLKIRVDCIFVFYFEAHETFLILTAEEYLGHRDSSEPSNKFQSSSFILETLRTPFPDDGISFLVLRSLARCQLSFGEASWFLGVGFVDAIDDFGHGDDRMTECKAIWSVRVIEKVYGMVNSTP